MLKLARPHNTYNLLVLSDFLLNAKQIVAALLGATHQTLSCNFGESNAIKCKC